MILFLAKLLMSAKPGRTLQHAKRLAWVGVALVAVATLAGLALWLSAREESDDAANRNIGAAVQREGDLAKTIERTEQANAARAEIQTSSGRNDAAYVQCLRTARTPANCQRFLPSIKTD